MVSWGVVEGTSIGYVYAWDWESVQTRTLFGQAIDILIHQNKVQGLILDYRTNWGGNEDYAIDGYKQLFNFDPTLNNSQANRVRGGDHLSFVLGPVFGEERFVPGSVLFDRPIAVLTGPLGGSAGDYNAFRMRFHPMVRFFGEPTAGAYTSFTNWPGTNTNAWYGTLTDPYFCRVDDASLTSNYNNEGYLIHKPFPVDEEVWLTRDGVTKGKDDVVERALAWITGLTYAHDVSIYRSYTGHHLDSVFVTARLTDPLNHSAALSAIVTDTGGVVRDSVLLYNDGMHHDGQAGDSVWGCRISLPPEEGMFRISVRTVDITQGSFRKLPNIGGFATAGPLTLDSVGVTLYRGFAYQLTPYVRNNGSSFTVRGASVTILWNDSLVTSITTTGVGLPDLPPGVTMGSTTPVYAYFNAAAKPTYLNLRAEISVGGVTYWTDSTKRTLTGIGKQAALPVRYILEQNYPNPFNPATTITYALPHSSKVFLAVYNTLGQQVATLVDESREVGYHEVRFDGSRLASGIYFYRLQAGDFIQSKKCLLLK
jgi:hypothetical protein